MAGVCLRTHVLVAHSVWIVSPPEDIYLKENKIVVSMELLLNHQSLY